MGVGRGGWDGMGKVLDKLGWTGDGMGDESR